MKPLDTFPAAVILAAVAWVALNLSHPSRTAPRPETQIPTMLTAPAASPVPLAGAHSYPIGDPRAPRSLTYVNGVGWIEHDSRISAMRAIGEGAGPRGPAPPTADQVIGKGLGLQGTDLEKPAHH